MQNEVGQSATDFSLIDHWGGQVSLSDFRGSGPVVLVFFPLAFSGICTGELCELQENLGLFAAEGVTLLGISVDSTFSLRAWSEKEGYEFPLLSDFWPHGGVAQDYGVFLAESGRAARATVVIDGDGVVRARFQTAPGEARPISAYREALAAIRSR